MIDNEQKRAAGMQPMEIMGALTVRLIHDLTNHLTILAGNAQVLEMVQNNPERLKKVIGRIRASSEAAGDLLDRFSKFRQQLDLGSAPFSLSDCMRDLERLNPMAGNWILRAKDELPGQIDLESRWRLGRGLPEMLRLVGAKGSMGYERGGIGDRKQP